MKLAKAKEILELNIKEGGNKMPPDCKQALELAVKAISRVQYDRLTTIHRPHDLLAGEKEE